MLPEPGQIGGATVVGDADDLIAKMADAEIDKLMAEDDSVFAPPTFESRGARHENETPALPTIEPASAPDPVADLDRSQDAATAVTAALDAIAPAAEPVTESPVISEPAETSADADAVAAELAADARLHGRSVETPAATETAVDDHTPSSEASADPHHSADEHHASEPLPTIGDLAAAATSAVPDAAIADPHTSVSSFGARVTQLPWAVLDAINYPVRDLSDKARESLGVVALVTLVNAIGLMTYHLFFAK